MTINYTTEQLIALPDTICKSLLENGFKHIRSPSYTSAAAPCFRGAEGVHCFLKEVSDGYIHVGVAKSYLRDSNNAPRLRIGVTISQSDLIYSVPGFYTIMFPWGMVHEAIQWIEESTEGMTRLRGNPNYVPGLYLQPHKAKARAFINMFISKMRRLMPF